LNKNEGYGRINRNTDYDLDKQSVMGSLARCMIEVVNLANT
jgi:hypothetical protein